MTVRPVTTLPAVPGLGRLYARAVLPGLPWGHRDQHRHLEDDARGGQHGLLPALPDVTYRVADVQADPDRLVAFQRLVGEPVDERLPAGFVHVLAFPVAMAVMVRDDFPLPLAGLVHLANAVTVHRTITVDEHLEVHAWAQDLRPHPRGTQVDLVTEVSARHRESTSGDTSASTVVVWRGVSTYLSKSASRAMRPAATGPAAALAQDDPTADRSADDHGAADRGVTQAETGRAAGAGAFVPPVPTSRWTLDAGTGRRYASVSGDRNPIHLSALTARPFGFRKAIAHGMYTASRVLAQVGSAARTDAFEWTVEFASPVLLPATVDLALHTEAGTTSFTGWDARSQRLHLSGEVVPLSS